MNIAAVQQLQTNSNNPIGNFNLDQDCSAKAPAKAVIQVLHRTSPLRFRNRNSPDSEVIPRLDLSPVIVGKSRAWLAGDTGGGSGGDRGAAHMRRTASLDAIFNKGSKDTEPRFSLLLLNKTTQTPEEWVPCCLAEVTPGCGGCSLENANGSLVNSGSSSGNSSRRASGSVPSSPWSTGGVPPPTSGENFEKFIRQRLQRANKEGSGAAGSRHSPIHGDHSVLAKPYACVQTHHICTTSNEGSIRSASVPQLPRPLLPRLRSSVEELNQEIERLVLRPQSHHGSEEEEEWSSLQQDGRRAPIPDYFRFRRSVNTQTPARYSSGASGNGSDQSTPPSMSPTFSPPPPVHDATPPDSPPGSLRLSAIASPHINKFLTREPPDGCEKVALKHSEEKVGTTTATNWPTTKPAPVFTLLPSLGSAFYAPGRTSGPGRGPAATDSKEEKHDIAETSTAEASALLDAKPSSATTHHQQIECGDSREPCPSSPLAFSAATQ